MGILGNLFDLTKGEGTPEGPAPPSEEAPTAAQPSLGNQWKEFLAQPGNAAAMVQFGIKAMQPISPGQSLMGHLGNAVGAAGEAKQKVTQTRTSEDLKKAQTDYYKQRSDNVGVTGGLTDNQQLIQQNRERTLILQAMDDYLGMNGGDYGDAYSSGELMQNPELFSQLYAEFQSTLFPGGSGGGAQGLGAAVGGAGATAAPPVTRKDTQGRTWTLQNGQWVQIG